ncbi:MAG: formate dehydrogenase accessory sulfurtransferase FdhD [Betaproteobacteria bacterium]|nr:formate dehydrogenase accessory sulfurtransferase FdhD [Betaproteobacteria bacterium]
MKLQTALSASLAEEVPVALVFNGISHAVMMATPLQLEDFALGFALSEGLIDLASHMYGVEVIEQEQGIELHIDIAAQCEVRLKERKRSMAGRTGCGLCGTDSLAQVKLSLPQAPEVHLDIQAMQRAHAGLRAMQPLKLQTGATHAAAWSDAYGVIQLVREDVGRHNALDKLIGAMTKAHLDATQGFICITSRASFEMVQKTIQSGAGALTAVSAPTRLAVDIALSHNLLLAGQVRGDSFTAYSYPERFLSTAFIESTET